MGQWSLHRPTESGTPVCGRGRAAALERPVHPTPSRRRVCGAPLAIDELGGVHQFIRHPWGASADLEVETIGGAASAVPALSDNYNRGLPVPL
eukprot:SAG11_NODE_6468_length_1307_cov_4.106788_2_plen_93_part_00